MLFAKRREPCGGLLDRGSAKHLKEDQAAIYEHTLRLLKNGARVSSSPTKKGQGAGPRGTKQATSGSSGAENGTAVGASNGYGEGVHMGMVPNHQYVTAGEMAGRDAEGTCFVCLVGREETSCSHCSRSMCDLCSRQCDACQEVFCTGCSTPNYDERLDRTFCLDCNLEEMKRGRRRPAAAGTGPPPRLSPHALPHSSNGFPSPGFRGHYSSLGALA